MNYRVQSFVKSISNIYNIPLIDLHKLWYKSNFNHLDYLNTYKLNYTLDMIPLDLDTKDEIIYKLIGQQANDLNSSTFRESMTLLLCNVNQIHTKHSYDGVDNNGIFYEVKPKNITSNSKNKLSGQGNFSDYTIGRHKKYMKDDVKMIISGFFNGKIIYIFQFDYNDPIFSEKIHCKLKQKFKEDIDIKCEYYRNLAFNSSWYSECKSIRLLYIKPNNNETKHILTKNCADLINKLRYSYDDL